MLGSLISAGASLVGGLLGNKGSKDNAEMNAAMQKEFAQHGVRWKVEDATKAGIHPLYALGSQTIPFSPVSYDGSSIANGFANAGSDIARGMEAKTTAPERFQSLQERLLTTQIEGQEIENAYRASQLARLKDPTQMPPALPYGGSSGGQSDVERLASQYTSARSGAPYLEAAPPTPAMKEFQYKTGGVWELPSEQAKNAIEDVLPYEIEHYVLNRLFPGVQKYFIDEPQRIARDYVVPWLRNAPKRKASMRAKLRSWFD